METIKYKDKEYKVSDRIEYVISKLEIKEDDDILDILESKNYQEGRISEQFLLLYLIDSVNYVNTDLKILLTSVIFGTGLVSYDAVSKLSGLNIISELWKKLDDSYNQGDINDEMIELICKMCEEDDEYLTVNETTIENIIHLLTSEAAKNFDITDETIKLMATLDNLIEIKNEIISKIIFIRPLLNDEIISLILKEESELICEIVKHIIISGVIDEVDKVNCILAVLSLENKSNLEEVYDSYFEKGKASSLYSFASNFVQHTLPLLECGLTYTRKRQKETN